MASTGATLIESIIDTDIVGKKYCGFIYEEITSIENMRSNVTEGTYYMLTEDFSAHLDVMLKNDGMSIMAYNCFLKRNGLMLDNYTIYQPTKEGVLFSSGKCEMVYQVQKPTEHYEIKQLIYMHTVLVKGGTFDLSSDLMLYTLKHYLGNFKNPRSCTSCDATLNFYYGLTQDLYVRATPLKAKSDILRYFN
jgi:hypothetical protein